jgi:hypothetical protein
MSILNVFFEKKKDEKPVPAAKLEPVTALRTEPVPVAEFEQFRAKFKAILDEENRKNHPGNDFYEFVIMKNAMIAIPQEDVRYKAAYAGWAVGLAGDPKSILLNTAAKYLALVETEMKDFDVAYKKEFDSQVTGNEQLLANKRNKVMELEHQLNLLRQEVVDIEQRNNATASNLKSTHDAFVAAGEAQRQEIMGEVDKINQFIN